MAKVWVIAATLALAAVMSATGAQAQCWACGLSDFGKALADPGNMAIQQQLQRDQAAAQIRAGEEALRLQQLQRQIELQRQQQQQQLVQPKPPGPTFVYGPNGRSLTCQTIGNQTFCN